MRLIKTGGCVVAIVLCAVFVPLRTAAFSIFLEDELLVEDRYFIYLQLHNQFQRDLGNLLDAPESPLNDHQQLVVESVMYWGLQTVQHEVAHYRYAQRKGWDPDFHMSGLSSAVLIPSDSWSSMDSEERAEFAGTGLNTVELMASKLNDPLPRLMARFQNSLYFLDGPDDYHDVPTWRDALTAREGEAPSRDELLYRSLAVDLVNPYTWRDLWLLRDAGRRRSSTPMDARHRWAYVPELCYFLAPGGDLVGAEFLRQTAYSNTSLVVAREVEDSHWTAVMLIRW